MRKILLIIFTFLVTVVFAQQAPLELNNGWLFRQAGKGNWLPATVPGSVFADLLKNKIIEDPFYRDNEKRVQWVDTADWEYQCTFSIPEKYSKRKTSISYLKDWILTLTCT
jgi:beta-mannosidase